MSAVHTERAYDDVTLTTTSTWLINKKHVRWHVLPQFVATRDVADVVARPAA